MNLGVTELHFAPSQLLFGVFEVFDVLSHQYLLVRPILDYFISVRFPTFFSSCEASAWVFYSSVSVGKQISPTWRLHMSKDPRGIAFAKSHTFAHMRSSASYALLLGP